MPAGTCEWRCRKRKWIANFRDASRFDQDPCFSEYDYVLALGIEIPCSALQEASIELSAFALRR
jgi:hypothetical protein